MISTVFPVLSIVVLYFIHSQLIKLGLVVVFSAVCSATLALMTDARNVEIIAATAASECHILALPQRFSESSHIDMLRYKLSSSVAPHPPKDAPPWTTQRHHHPSRRKSSLRGPPEILGWRCLGADTTLIVCCRNVSPHTCHIRYTSLLDPCSCMRIVSIGGSHLLSLLSGANRLPSALSWFFALVHPIPVHIIIICCWRRCD